MKINSKGNVLFKLCLKFKDQGCQKAALVI